MININETDMVEGENEELAVRRSRERDETQTAIDGRVKALIDAWRAMPNHKNAAENKRPKIRFVVAKDDVRELKRIIRRAFTLHKAEPVWFKDHTLENGDVAVKFTVTDLPVKSAAPVPADTEPDGGAETQTATGSRARGGRR